jgi:tryptophanyl-tRNA synthetase
MSLTDPGKKMSKSALNPKSRILITDSREEIFKKINGSLTDSEDGITYDPATRPGLSNLIEIAYNLEEEQGFLGPEDLAHNWANLSKKAVKERVASIIDAHLAPVRDRYFNFMDSKGERIIQGLAKNGAEKANARAAETMELIRYVVGVR